MASTVDIDAFNLYKDKKLLRCQKHPNKNLYIWNYTDLVQFENHWDHVTEKARGLVTDHRGNVMAHSFKKFYNLNQNLHTPTEKFRVFDKMDGSMIILFWHQNEWIVASRGSFVSDQAVMAEHLLKSKYDYDAIQSLDKNLTYVFEVIYPHNRIVVNYGDIEEMVFLAAFYKDGMEADFDVVKQYIEETNIPVVKEYTFTDYLELASKNEHNKEGYVVVFSNGERVKIKFQEYLELHRAISNINALRVWEAFQNRTPIEEFVSTIPDEFMAWVKEKYAKFQQEYDTIYNTVTSRFVEIKRATQSRADFAKMVNADVSVRNYSKLLFHLYNFKDIRDTIIQMIRPHNGVMDVPFTGRAQEIMKEDANKGVEEVDVNTDTKLKDETPSNKLIVLIGVSGSGKSTWASEYIKTNPNTVRVNRDAMRQQLYGYDETTIKGYYQLENYQKLENMVTDAESAIITSALKNGKDVIVDNTNLKRAYIERYTKKYREHPIEFKLFTDPVEVCIARDAMRPCPVGEATINAQQANLANLLQHYKFANIPAYKYKIIKQNPALPHGYVFDIDGTLADNTNRDPYDWSRVGNDEVIPAVKETLLSHFKEGYKIIICTGRDGVCTKATMDWLDSNGIFYDEFHIRPQGDRSPDWKVKEQMWKKITQTTYVVAMYDDRDSVVKHARRCGFKVFQVNYGDF
jgi:RNA ligase